MVRPMKPRRVRFDPDVTYFKPRAVPLSILEEVDLGVDELEAIRLCDFKNLDQIKAAKKMKLSQSTLQRILSSAHKKIAEALIEGKAIKIKAKGREKLDNNLKTRKMAKKRTKKKTKKPCPGSKIRSKGRGKGLGRGKGKGPISPRPSWR